MKQDSWRVDKLRQVMEFPFAGRGLSERQAEVARLAAFGYTTDEIAEVIERNRNTAGAHLMKIKKKLGLGKFDLTRDLIKQIEEILK